MDKLRQVLGRLGAAQLSELVGIETLENMNRWFRVNITRHRLVDILEQRHGSKILGNSKIRQLTVDHLEKFEKDYVLGGASRVTWSYNSGTAKRLIQTLDLTSDYLPKAPIPQQPAKSMIGCAASLHKYQFSVKTRAKKSIEQPSSRVLIHMPTGAGKTRTACELMVDMLRSENPGEALIIWLAHSEELCLQAVEAIERAWTAKGDHDAEILRLWGTYPKPTIVPERGFVIASFQTVYAMLTSASRDLQILRQIGARTKMIVIDEAHKAIAPTYETAISALSMASIPPRIVGLTATPGRSDDPIENRKLTHFFNDKKISLADDDGNELSDGIGYLQELGVLAKLVREPIETKISIDLTNEEIKQLSNLMELPESFLKRLGGQHERNLLIFNKMMQLCDEGRQVILFACSVAHAELLSDLCVSKNIPARLVTGKTAPEDRLNWIDEYKRGQVQFLINYGVLTTGFDAPNTDTVFITRPTASVVLYSQMIGRAIRGKKNGGNEYARIIDVVDNLNGMPTENLAFNYFNNIWN